MRRYAALAASTLLGAAGLLSAPALMPSAAAKAAQNGDVGTIVGYYFTASEGGREYSGLKFPANRGECVDVQRKTLSTGVWTTSGIVNYRACSVSTPTDWVIRDPGYISNTVAIRLVDIGTKDTAHPEFVVLCASKVECLAM